jgi:hypothetical protein
VEYFCCFLLGRGKNKKKIRVIRDHIQYDKKKSKNKGQMQRVRLFDWIFGEQTQHAARAHAHTSQTRQNKPLQKSLEDKYTHRLFFRERRNSIYKTGEIEREREDKSAHFIRLFVT